MRSISLSKFLSAILSKILPDRTKRLVLLSSLYALICGTTSFDSETINKLNKVMKLSNKDKAWEFPMQLSSVIWRNYEQQFAVYPFNNIQDTERVISSIIAKIPNCLRYSDDQSIIKDISRLFTFDKGSSLA